MSYDDVIEEFRPIFRAELPDILQRIRLGLEPDRADYSDADLETTFREAHNLGSTAAYMEAREVAVAAKALAALARALLTAPAPPATLSEAKRAYDRLQAAAVSFLGSNTDAGEGPRAS